MANNSLQIKCWSIAIVAAIVALTDGVVILFAIAPIALFFYLDSKYLSLERSFRNLYDFVRVKDESDIDFSMDITNYKVKLSKVVISWPIITFYAVLLVAIIVIGFIRGF